MIVSVGAAIAMVAVVTPVSAADGTRAASRQPLAVQSATLVQQGQDLVWTLELAQPFSPGALQRDGQSLCLLFERAGNGSAVSRACLSGPRRKARGPELIYLPTGRRSGAGAVAATITRSSDRELTASFLPQAVGLHYRPLRWQVASTVTTPGCAPAAPAHPVCTELFPAEPALVRLHTPQQVGCTLTGPDWVFHGPADKREIALTFDDRPWWEPPTSQFVLLLAQSMRQRRSSRSASTSPPTIRTGTSNARCSPTET